MRWKICPFWLKMCGMDDGGAKPGLTALVVENDLTSRELLARVLRARGMEAITAIGTAQAAGLLLADLAFDLLVVDLECEDGVELLKQIAVMAEGRRPRKVAVLSGLLANDYGRLSAIPIPIELFQKPLHVGSLMRMVEELKAGVRTKMEDRG